MTPKDGGAGGGWGAGGFGGGAAWGGYGDPYSYGGYGGTIVVNVDGSVFGSVNFLGLVLLFGDWFHK